MGQFSKLTEGFDQTKNSWVACGRTINQRVVISNLGEGTARYL
jgi:hypothetical protein